MASKSNGSIVAVLDRVIGVPAKSNDNNDDNDTDKPAFLPSSKFSGSKAGYVFRTAHLGTGYYLDAPDASSVPREAKRVRLDHGNDNDNQHDVTAKPRSVRFDATKDSTHAIPPRQQPQQQPTGEELLAQAEAANLPHPSSARHLLDAYSPKSIQSACTALDKTYSKNMMLRAQHADEPEKFMMNEVQLNDEIVSFKNVAVFLASYETIVDGGAVATFLALLSHENSDVAMSVINVLVELLDPGLLREDVDRAQLHEEKDNNTPETRLERRMYNIGLLGNAFVEGGGLEALASNLGRFDETVEEDARGVEDTLTLLEYLLDLDRAGALRHARSDGEDDESPSVVASLCKTKLLSWLLNRIGTSNHHADAEDATASAPISPAVLRLHASEVLATILQHEDYSMKQCGTRLASCPEYTSAFNEGDEKPRAADATVNGQNGGEGAMVDGMEILLLSIAAYRKADPQIEVECEFLENVFDALAASLLRADNVQDFVEKEGIELMLRCIREKVHSGGGALKSLSTPVDSNFVPLYMARKSVIPCPAACSEGGSELAKKAMTGTNGAERSKRAKRAAHARKKWLAEVEENVINVMYALTRHIEKDSKYDSYSRLLVKFVEEECEKCDRTIELCLKYDEKARISEYQYFRSDEAEEAEQLGLDVDVAALGAKLRGGGDIFHRLCAILSFACVGSARSHGHVRDQLKLQGSSISVIKEGLAEFASLLVEGSQKTQIEYYLSSIYHKCYN
eukprot:CCRYP_016672-RA/>CCRYP_016672-RA protein AED:0.07 eAED:0.07 QI:0/0.66/0.5/1/1/1/4/395/740